MFRREGDEALSIVGLPHREICFLRDYSTYEHAISLAACGQPHRLTKSVPQHTGPSS